MPSLVAPPEPIEWSLVEIGKEDALFADYTSTHSDQITIDALEIMFDGWNSSSSPAIVTIEIRNDEESTRRERFYVPVFGGTVIYPVRDRSFVIPSGHTLSVKAAWPGAPYSTVICSGKIIFV